VLQSPSPSSMLLPRCRCALLRPFEPRIRVHPPKNLGRPHIFFLYGGRRAYSFFWRFEDILRSPLRCDQLSSSFRSKFLFQVLDCSTQCPHSWDSESCAQGVRFCLIFFLTFSRPALGGTLDPPVPLHPTKCLISRVLSFPPVSGFALHLYGIPPTY